MKTQAEEETPVLETERSAPAISIVLPFEPKMMQKAEIAAHLQEALADAKAKMQAQFPGPTGQMVLQKLNAIVDLLNYMTYKKSIAIYVSPVFEKVLYLDMEVSSYVAVDDAFEIRDLVTCKIQQHKYLVLHLHESGFDLLLGNDNTLVTVISDNNGLRDSYEHPLPENAKRLTADHQDFIRYHLNRMDSSLSIMLSAYELPLFVIAAPMLNMLFANFSKHQPEVIRYITCSCDPDDKKSLLKELLPVVNNWKSVKEKEIYNKLAIASAEDKLAQGLKDVWKQANRQNGQLLIMDKTYRCASFIEDNSSTHVFHPNAIGKYSHAKDAVDDVIEKVLEQGGHVEFVEAGMLKAYDRIVLVQKNVNV